MTDAFKENRPMIDVSRRKIKYSISPYEISGIEEVCNISIVREDDEINQ